MIFRKTEKTGNASDLLRHAIPTATMTMQRLTETAMMMRMSISVEKKNNRTSKTIPKNKPDTWRP